MGNRNLYKVAIEVLLFGICVFLLFSCLPSGILPGIDKGFDLGDKPSDYVWPHNDPPKNFCGTGGAFLAYYLMYYVGPGIFILLLTMMWWLAFRLSGIEITQRLLRLAGMFLLVTVLSSTVYLIWSYSSDGFPMGNGGILGIATGHFLKTNAGTLGTFIVILSAWAFGSLLLADTLVLSLLRWFGTGASRFITILVPAWARARHSSAIGDIWTRISLRQKEEGLQNVRITKTGDLQIEALDEEDQEDDYEYEDEEDSEEYEQEDLSEEPEAEKKSHKPAPASQVRRKRKKKKKTARPPQPAEYVPKSYEDYEFPPLTLLKEPELGYMAKQSKMVDRKAKILEGLLAEFGVNANVVNAEPGPAITMYELELAPGIKVSQISNLANDMARALGAGSVRVVAPLPGKHTIGIEAPNTERETVRIKGIIDSSGNSSGKMQIPLFLGKSSSGEALVSDLAAMPHLLIAGTTGSGKSVCINSIITSILMTRRPDEVQLILIDPKMVEMAAFESIPHLMCPTITEMRKAEQILEWATTKMDERYELLAEAKVRNIASYNKLSQEEIIARFNPSTPEEEAKIPKNIPSIVIIIDELADLMMTSAKEVESYIVRIAQKSRAVGIHLVLATQRPQATVVTGLIKSNMPARIAFRVAARMDSRIILDQNGGETLLGQGDMLFLKPGTSELVRSQGAFLDDEETFSIVNFLKEVAAPQFHPELMQLNKVDISGMSKDDLYDDAIKVVLESGRGSVSLLQRRLSVGYARASRMIEMMAAGGLLGEYKGSQAREVTMTLEEYEAMKRQMVEDQVAGYADLTRGVESEDDEYEYEEVEEGDEHEDDEDDEIEEEDEDKLVDQKQEDDDYEDDESEDDDDDEYLETVEVEYVDDEEEEDYSRKCLPAVKSSLSVSVRHGMLFVLVTISTGRAIRKSHKNPQLPERPLMFPGHLHGWAGPA